MPNGPVPVEDILTVPGTDYAVTDLKVALPSSNGTSYRTWAFVTWQIDDVAGVGQGLAILHGVHGTRICYYPPGAWKRSEVTRFYRTGDDPPEYLP